MAAGLRLSLVPLYIYIAIHLSATSAQGLTANNTSPRARVVAAAAASQPAPRYAAQHRTNLLASFGKSSYSHKTTRVYALEPPDIRVVHDASIRGPVSNKATTVQAELRAQHEAEAEKRADLAEASGLGRALLHGGHMNPTKFPFCSDCGLVRCWGSFCDGHCRNPSKGGTLEWCSTNNSFPKFASEYDDNSDVKNRPPDSIDDNDTVVIRLKRRVSTAQTSQTADYMSQDGSFPDGYEEDYQDYQDNRPDDP